MGPTATPPSKFSSPSRYSLAIKPISCPMSSDANSHSSRPSTASREWALGEVPTPQLAHSTTKRSLAVSTASPNSKYRHIHTANANVSHETDKLANYSSLILVLYTSTKKIIIAANIKKHQSGTLHLLPVITYRLSFTITTSYSKGFTNQTIIRQLKKLQQKKLP